MISEEDFSKMLPYEYTTDTIFVHQCFTSLFSGMLNWIGDVLYPRFNYKVITTYDKAVEVFTKKMKNPDGSVQTSFLPALTLDPVLDFSNDERAGRFPWMFRNLHLNGRNSLWNKIKLTDQGVSITPMFTRYQGTVEVTGWFPSMYELIDFRVALLQYCNGYQRWIRPEKFWSHLILPKEIIEMDGPEGKVDWKGINPEIITLTTTTTKEYALPFQLDAMWRLDSFSDATNKMGSDQIAEYKCTATFTWECNIPTFIKIQNYQYPISNINLNISMTPTEAKYPLHMGYPLYRKLNLKEEIVKFSKITPIYNIETEGISPLIKIQDDMCDTYPKTYQKYDHYVRGKLYDITKLTSPDDIKDIESILVIDKYTEEYLPYVRRCRGLISRYDNKKCFKIMTVARDYRISLLCDIKDVKLYNAILTLHNRDITFDVLGKVIYDGIQKVKIYGPQDDFSKFTFNHNLIRMIKEFNLKESIKKEYILPFGDDTVMTKIDCNKKYICEQFTGISNKKTYTTKYLINGDCKDSFTLKINGIDCKDFTINNFDIVIGQNVDIKDGDIISLYRDSDCVVSDVNLICNYKISKQDEIDYYGNKKLLAVDISNCRLSNLDTIQCISYNGLMNQTIDFIVDKTNKKVVFNIEPHRDCYIQIFGTPL